MKDSDVLFVVDKGIVSESGTHDSLLEKKGLYHKLVSTQVRVIVLSLPDPLLPNLLNQSMTTTGVHDNH